MQKSLKIESEVNNLDGIGVLYYWTWFIWPFVFIFSLAHGISSIIKDNKKSDKTLLMVSAISLLIILAGITSLAFM